MKRLVVKITGEVHMVLDDVDENEDMEALARDLFSDACPDEMDLQFDGFSVEEV